MKIMHVIPTFEGGGAEKQLSLLAKKQSEKGIEVHIALRRLGGVNNKILKGTRVKIHLLGDYKSINPILIYKLYKLIKIYRPHILQTWLPQMDIIGGISSFFLKIKWVVSIRNAEIETPSNLFYLFRRLIIPFSDAIIANSNLGANYWKKFVNNKKIYVIDNAVDFNEININANNIKALSKNYFLVVGRLHEHKNNEIIIDGFNLAHKKIPHNLYFIGNGPSYESLILKVKKLNIQNRVIFLDYDSKWWHFSKKATALISMSNYEGQPNVLLEAAVCNCPLILSDTISHREIFNKKTALFVPSSNPKTLAFAMLSIINNNKAARIRSNLIAKKIKKLTIDKCFSKYLEVYKKICVQF